MVCTEKQSVIADYDLSCDIEVFVNQQPPIDMSHIDIGFIFRSLVLGDECRVEYLGVGITGLETVFGLQQAKHIVADTSDISIHNRTATATSTADG